MIKTKHVSTLGPSGKGWLHYGKQVVLVVGKVAAIVLAAPFKLPGKLLMVSKYLMIAAGIISSADPKEDE